MDATPKAVEFARKGEAVGLKDKIKTLLTIKFIYKLNVMNLLLLTK
jgi:hypothetical protein